MADDAFDLDEIVLPALLRAARSTYSAAISDRLAAGGFDDVPANAPFLLGGMVNQGVPAADLLRSLGTSRQAQSQLVDTLVLRGYLVRDVDPADRRRIVVEPTERGRAAALLVGEAVGAVEAELVAAVGADGVHAVRVGLLALAEIGDRARVAAGSGG